MATIRVFDGTTFQASDRADARAKMKAALEPWTQDGDRVVFCKVGVNSEHAAVHDSVGQETDASALAFGLPD